MPDAPKQSLSPSQTTPPEEPQGSLGAVLIGGAILLVAGLLIFWPDGDSAAKRGGKGERAGAGQQASHMSDDDRALGRGGGIAPRPVDPAEGRSKPQVTPGLMAETKGLAMLPERKPEPTSFPTPAAEIAYVEKKLEQARADVVARSTFLDRMKKIQAEAPISETERNAARAKIVQENYDKAQDRVEELQRRLAELKRKHGG